MSQWSQYFFVDGHLSKVTFHNQLLTVDHSGLSHTLKIDIFARFSCEYDIYGNLQALILKAGKQIRISHNNPTVLEQWQSLISDCIHKTDFYADYYPGEKIGEGISASVHSAYDKLTKNKVAVKVFSRSAVEKSSKQFLSLQNEISILKQLNSSYFPRFISTYLTEKSYYLVYQWCEGITLKEWVNAGLACERQVKVIVADVVRALEELRQLGIIHRDIKPENIIYDRKQRTTKIVDFGFATYAANRNHVYPNCGTPGYAAPELLDKRNTIITFSADIFSLGVTLYFLLFGKLPYQDNSKNMLLANKEGRFAFSRALINNPSACDLIRRMVCPLRERITLQQLACHPYLSGAKLDLLQDGGKNNSSFFGKEVLSKASGLERDDLEFLNKKIQQKREERVRRERILSIRTQSRIKRCFSRQRSYNKANHTIITQRI